MSTLTVKRGDTWVWPFTYKDQDGAAIDLTGCTARLQVKAQRATEPTLSASSAEGGVTMNPTGGVVTVRFEPADTELVEPGKYDADIEMTWSDGSVQSSATFSVVVKADITI